MFVDIFFLFFFSQEILQMPASEFKCEYNIVLIAIKPSNMLYVIYNYMYYT